MTENTGYFRVSGKPKIKLRAPQYVYVRMLLVYTLLYTLAFALGCLLFHFLKIKESQILNTRILSYFSMDFSSCEDIFDFAKQSLSVSSQDLSHLFVVFTAGFTMLAGLVVSALLIFRGFSLGFSISYLAYAVRENLIDLAHPFSSVILYSLLCALGAAIMLHAAVKSTLFSDDFKALCGRPSRIIRSKALYTHIFRFLIAFGAFLILNLIRCIL